MNIKILKADIKRFINYHMIGSRIKGMRITDVFFSACCYDGIHITTKRDSSIFSKYDNCVAFVLEDFHILFLGDYNAEDHLDIDDRGFGGDEIMAAAYPVWYLYTGDHHSKKEDREPLRQFIIGMKICRVKGWFYDGFSMSLKDESGMRHIINSNRLWWDRVFLKGVDCYVR